ncbi:hypothetical protein C2E23DRAFT_938815 [Lenzites betulinus]|nr:hypothetical protein C2E23DRAFT_938815 [Lenzites betulinus]
MALFGIHVRTIPQAFRLSPVLSGCEQAYPLQNPRYCPDGHQGYPPIVRGPAEALLDTQTIGLLMGIRSGGCTDAAAVKIFKPYGIQRNLGDAVLAGVRRSRYVMCQCECAEKDTGHPTSHVQGRIKMRHWFDAPPGQLGSAESLTNRKSPYRQWPVGQPLALGHRRQVPRTSGTIPQLTCTYDGRQRTKPSSVRFEGFNSVYSGRLNSHATPCSQVMMSASTSGSGPEDGLLYM